MDTTLSSSKRSSSILTNTLSAILSVGAVVWAASAMAGVATAQTSSARTVTSTVRAWQRLVFEQGIELAIDVRF